MKPFVNALLLADHVHFDALSGKCTIVATFGHIAAQKFPCIHVGAFIYANLSDFKGVHKLSFRFVRDSDGQQIAQSSAVTIKHAHKLQHHEIALKLPPLSFDRPGAYAIEMLWDGEWVGAVKISVQKRRKTK